MVYLFINYCDSLPVEQGQVEGTQGEAESDGTAVDPEQPETAQPPVSEAAQTSASHPLGDPTQSALTSATTNTTQSVAVTPTSNNTISTVATVHQTSTPDKEAPPAILVPGITDQNPEDTTADEGSGIKPPPDLKTAIEDHLVSHSMSGLQLGDHPTPRQARNPITLYQAGLACTQKVKTHLPILK